MSKWKTGDWERTLEVINGDRLPVENGQTWLRHGADRKDGSSFKIDLEVLKGNSTIEEIARAVGCPIERVKSHLAHLQDKKDPSMEPHQLKLTNLGGKIRFDLRDPPSTSGTAADNKWSDDEYKAAVKAYLWMLEQEQNGKPYSKSEVNQSLRDGRLAARTKASVEYRMQNISAVLEELSLPWIKGYVPAKNVGPDGREKIKQMLIKFGAYDPMDYAPTDDPDSLDQKVQKLRKKINLLAPPKGQKSPKKTSTVSSSFARDPAVKAWVLENAKGLCEGCMEPAPFSTSTGDPFLEVHHLKQLSDDGSDTITNAIAVCPNCHRRCHHSSDKVPFINNLYFHVERLVRE